MLSPINVKVFKSELVPCFLRAALVLSSKQMLQYWFDLYCRKETFICLLQNLH
jgi:hypothetical protein